jgi:hypothetical protein
MVCTPEEGAMADVAAIAQVMGSEACRNPSESLKSAATQGRKASRGQRQIESAPLPMTCSNCRNQQVKIECESWLSCNTVVGACGNMQRFDQRL